MHPRDEGYIKYNLVWQKTPPLKLDLSSSLAEYRQKAYEKGWIGVYPDGIGFGNISQRIDQNSFMISGSKTGHIDQLTKEHWSLVTSFDATLNQVHCKGPIQASSESMSHGIIYKTMSNIHAVIHIHSLALWQKHLYKLPTTPASVEYGTPKMAEEIASLISLYYKDKNKGIVLMAGHEEGIIAFGKSLKEAFCELLQL